MALINFQNQDIATLSKQGQMKGKVHHARNNKVNSQTASKEHPSKLPKKAPPTRTNRSIKDIVEGPEYSKQAKQMQIWEQAPRSGRVVEEQVDGEDAKSMTMKNQNRSSWEHLRVDMGEIMR